MALRIHNAKHAVPKEGLLLGKRDEGLTCRIMFTSFSPVLGPSQPALGKGNILNGFLPAGQMALRIHNAEHAVPKEGLLLGKRDEGLTCPSDDFEFIDEGTSHSSLPRTIVTMDLHIMQGSFPYRLELGVLAGGASVGLRAWLGLQHALFFHEASRKNSLDLECFQFQFLSGRPRHKCRRKSAAKRRKRCTFLAGISAGAVSDRVCTDHGCQFRNASRKCKISACV